MQPLISLWRETWWLWIAFLVVIAGMSVVVGPFFWLIAPCLPVVYAYFAYARYDMNGDEKPDLD